MTCRAKNAPDGRNFTISPARESTPLTPLAGAFEVDRAVLDLHVTRPGTNLPCDRRTLTIIMDALTRLPVGFQIDMDGDGEKCVSTDF